MNISVNTPVIEIKNASITFGNFKAVKNVTTSIGKNEIRFFIGPNGAGKTTLLDAICGKNKLSEGNILYNDGNREYSLPKIKEHKIVELGIGRKFQAPSVFSGITIQENMELAVAGSKGLFSSIKGNITKDERERIDDALNFVGPFILIVWFSTFILAPI